MGNKQNFIEINGKRYDAVTGVLIHPNEATPVPKPIQPVHHQPVVDGFVRRAKNTSAVRPTTSTTGKHPGPSLQKSKTLMRSAVKKPVVLQKKTVTPPPTVPLPTQKTAFGSVVITPRVATAPAQRQQHASDIQKSSLIHKFGEAKLPAPIVKKITPLEVRPAPALVVQPTAPSKSADLLERALEAAQSHNEPFYDHKKPLHTRISRKIGLSSRALAISTTVVAGLLLGGFYAYQNVPNLAMRVAATRAGFAASMPGYSPAGFSFNGPVQYTAGQVVVSFKSNTDERNYKLTQQTSTWTSDSLLNNYVVASGKEYQTYQDRGRTIYIYDGSNATWVNGGIWYQIDGKSSMSSDQLAKIASSL